VFKEVWKEWQAPADVNISWPFVLLGEAVNEREEDPPDLLAYHKGGFSYLRQPLDILRNFDDQYSLKQVLTQAWVATVEVGMATWKAIRARKATRDPDTQSRIELDFRKEWLHMNILGKDDATIRWHFLPPLYFTNFSND
jgi:hypothetical protein